MANQSTDLLAAIGAIQTLVENFPMGLLSALNVKNYSSSLEFLLDALRTLGINDKEIITFILEELVGVNDLNDVKMDEIDEEDAKFQNNAFVQTMESAVKFLVAEILANIISCSVWPKVPDSAIDDGIDLPLSIIDPTTLLDTCPTSQNGKKKYTGVASDMIPADLSGATDLNAFVWYCINMLNPGDSLGWSGKTKTDEICDFQNRGYKKVKLKIDPSFRGKTLFEFNKKYLNSISIFSPKVILMNIFDELMNGLPNVEINVGIDELYNAAAFQKMIDTVVSNDDMEVDDCYYTFSNEDWNRMIEDAELRKYNARKYGEDTKTANVIDKESVLETLDKASTAATLHDKIDIVTDALYDASKTKTIEYNKLVDEASYETKLSVDFEVNSAWLYNILSTIIRPIVKAAMTPKIMALIVVNYEIAGAMNLSEIDTTSSIDTILDFVKTKMLGLFAALIKKIKDLIVQAVLDFFNKKIAPLITKYVTAKLLEQLEGYLDLLRQAMECINVFGFPYLFGNGVSTGLDEVNYADITQTKNNPNKSVC